MICWLLDMSCGCVVEKADDETDPEDEEYVMLNMPPLRAVVNGNS